MLLEEQKKMLADMLAQDIGKKDVTSELLKPVTCTAWIKANEACTLAGLEEAAFLFTHKSKAKVVLHAKDGQIAKKGQTILKVHGTNTKILSAERTCLNVLSRMSGVATECKKASNIVQATKNAGKKTKIFLTRKTMPGFNEFDKKACTFGGVFPHRKNLAEMILIKENHLEFESMEQLMQKAATAKKHTPAKKIEVEAENEKQALLAAGLGADIVMLDNFSPAGAKKTVRKLRQLFPRVLVELSGGINLKNLKSYVFCKADIISMGCLTKEAKMIDFSLEIKK